MPLLMPLIAAIFAASHTPFSPPHEDDADMFTISRCLSYATHSALAKAMPIRMALSPPLFLRYDVDADADYAMPIDVY